MRPRHPSKIIPHAPKTSVKPSKHHTNNRAPKQWPNWAPFILFVFSLVCQCFRDAAILGPHFWSRFWPYLSSLCCPQFPSGQSRMSEFAASCATCAQFQLWDARALHSRSLLSATSTTSGTSSVLSLWGGSGRRKCPHPGWLRSSTGFP